MTDVRAGTRAQNVARPREKKMIDPYIIVVRTATSFFLAFVFSETILFALLSLSILPKFLSLSLSVLTL